MAPVHDARLDKTTTCLCEAELAPRNACHWHQHSQITAARFHFAVCSCPAILQPHLGSSVIPILQTNFYIFSSTQALHYQRRRNMSSPLHISHHSSRSVRGTDDHIIFRAANPRTGRISPSIAGSPPRGSSVPLHASARSHQTGHGGRIDFFNQSTAADYARLAQGFPRMPRLPRPGALYGPREQRVEAEPRIVQRQEHDERPAACLSPHEVQMRRPYSDNLAVKKTKRCKNKVKDEDRLRGFRTPQTIKIPVPRHPASVPVVSISAEPLRRRPHKDSPVSSGPVSIQEGGTEFGRPRLSRNALSCSKFEAPCKELRRLGSEILPITLTQDAVEQGESTVGTNERCSAQEKCLHLRRLPSVRLVPPCLAGIPLSEQGVQYARRPVSASWIEDRGLRVKIGLSLSDTVSADNALNKSDRADAHPYKLIPGSYPCNDAEDCGRGEEDSNPLLSPTTAASVCFVVDQLAAVLSAIVLIQAVSMLWSLLFHVECGVDGVLCWMLPD